MIMLHLLRVCFLLTAILSLSYGDDKPPKITKPKNDTLVIKSDEDIDLSCESNEPVNWTYPYYPDDEVTIQMDTKELSRTHYVSHLQRKKAKYYHTGNYTCWKVDNEYALTKVYIYVRNDNYPFAAMEEHLVPLTVLQYQPAVFDCRPNAPDIKVEFTNSAEEVRELGQSSEDGTVLEYNEKTGFILHHVNNKQGGMYFCRADGTFRTFLLTILTHSDSVARPIITTDHQHAVIGDNVTLNCKVTVDIGITFSLVWDIPPTSPAQKEGRVHIGRTFILVGHNDGGETGVGNITIYNIKDVDNGSYVCKVEDHAGNRNNVTFDIAVHDKDDSYIYFLMQEEEKIITQSIGSRAQWVVKLKVYPKPGLIWYRITPEGKKEEIKDNTKYKISTDSTATSTKLVIYDLKFSDRGIYILHVNNNRTIDEQKLTLIVKGGPQVDFDLDSGYSVGVPHNVSCKAQGYPRPTISWFIKPCEKIRNCRLSEVGFKEIPASSYHAKYTDDVTVISNLTIQEEQSSLLKCSAKNEESTSPEIKEFIVSDLRDGEDFKAWLPDVIVTGDNVKLHCGCIKENSTGILQWVKMVNDKEVPVDTSVYRVSNTSTKYSYRTTLSIDNIKKSDDGEYRCIMTDEEGNKSLEYVKVNVKDLKKPRIKSTTINATEWVVPSSEGLHLQCDFEGVPTPKVTWYKNDKPLLHGKNIILTRKNQTLNVIVLTAENEGVYKCKGENQAGHDSRSVTVKLKDKPGPNVTMITIIVIAAIILIILIAVLVIKIRNERILKNELAVAGLKHFEEGAMDSLNPDLPVDDQAELLPYDKKWEFPRDKLKLGKQLGAGAFGVVMKADAYGIVEGEPVSTVAVKMVKRNTDFTYIKALASELKIMVHLGKHLNVVNLLGACTNNIAKRELLVIVEYCRFGNLQNYLLRHRENFIDQVDLKTGSIDPTIGAEILSRTESFVNKSRIKYAALSFSNSSGNAPSSEDNMAVDYRTGAIGGQLSDGSNGEVSISMTPAGEDTCLMSNNSSQPEWRSNYRGDYKGYVRPICTRDLVCWAFQVARGMEYLSGRKVMHGDLAARNILLADDNIVKICDFGLAKSMYKSDNYKKKGDGPLPVKWMAIESIRDRVFSTQSDVWSFGIVLWEFFSLARTPYPGMEADEKLYNKLVDGYRMEKPPYATHGIYQTMQECWKAHPERRPTFANLSLQLGGFLEESVRRHYIELNDPYIDMNEQWLQGLSNDYLSMMNAPTYGNLVSPSFDECDSGYINSPVPSAAANALDAGEGSGYLCMKSPSTSNSPDIFSPRLATVGDTVFDFSTPQQKRLRFKETHSANGPELHPILKTIQGGSESDTDPVNDLNKGLNLEEKERNDVSSPTLPGNTGFSNPSYQSVPTIQPSTDNYINMPQHKNVSKAQTNSELSEKQPSGFSNPSYITMGLSSENKTPTNGNLQNPFLNSQYPITSGGNESYMNLQR